MRQLILGGLTVALLALVAEATLGTLSYAAARRYGRTAVA
jgi:ABC-type proline/glycine betaine transport system permease subunit